MLKWKLFWRLNRFYFSTIPRASGRLRSDIFALKIAAHRWRMEHFFLGPRPAEIMRSLTKFRLWSCRTVILPSENLSPRRAQSSIRYIPLCLRILATRLLTAKFVPTLLNGTKSTELKIHAGHDVLLKWQLQLPEHACYWWWIVGAWIWPGNQGTVVPTLFVPPTQTKKHGGCIAKSKLC